MYGSFVLPYTLEGTCQVVLLLCSGLNPAVFPRAILVAHLLALGVLSDCIANLQTKDCCVLMLMTFSLQLPVRVLLIALRNIKLEGLVSIHIVLDHDAHHISLTQSAHMDRILEQELAGIMLLVSISIKVLE